MARLEVHFPAGCLSGQSEARKKVAFELQLWVEEQERAGGQGPGPGAGGTEHDLNAASVPEEGLLGKGSAGLSRAPLTGQGRSRSCGSRCLRGGGSGGFRGIKPEHPGEEGGDLGPRDEGACAYCSP